MSDASAPAGYQVTLLVAAREAEAIASRLEQAIEPQALAVSLFDRGNGRFEVSALYAERPREKALIAALDGAAHGDLSIEPLAAADWVTLSQGKRGPVHAGRFLVHGSHDRVRVPKRRLAIEIDAGQAFGTAHHASTRGCLLALDDLLKRERPRVILDVGTGTGILAIAAAKALQCPVLASDEDRLAAAIAADNARKNRAGTLVERCHRARLRASKPQADRGRFAAREPSRARPLLLGARTRAAGEGRRDRHSLGPYPNPGANNRGAHVGIRLHPRKANHSRWVDDADAKASQQPQGRRLIAAPL